MPKKKTESATDNTKAVVPTESYPEGYEYITRRSKQSLKKVSLGVIKIWIMRYITKDVIAKFEPNDGDFVFYTKNIFDSCHIEQMLDEISEKGFISRFDWLPPEELAKIV